MARPKGSGERPVDIEQMKMWARAGATIPEMAKRLSVSHATLERRLQRKEFRDALEEAKAELYISLRSKQVALALNGNVTMLIWLGKQYLGQKDRHEFGGPNGGPIPFSLADVDQIISEAEKAEAVM